MLHVLLQVMRCSTNLLIYSLASDTFKKLLKSCNEKIKKGFANFFQEGKKAFKKQTPMSGLEQLSTKI